MGAITPTDDVESRIVEIYEKHRNVIAGQVVDIEDMAAAALCDRLDEEQRAKGERQAHKVAGSAGTFGFMRASEIARELEYAFAQFGSDPDLPRRIATLAVELRDALDQGPDELEEDDEEEDEEAPVKELPIVLVVDADRTFTTQLTDEAPAVDLRILTARNAASARRLMPSHVAAAVLNVDDEDAMELLDELSSREHPVPTLVFGESGTLADRLEMVRRGARRFLRKPFSTGQLLAAVDDMVDRLRVETMTVLAVDDDISVLDMISSSLNERGLRVETLDQPSRFWEELERVQPDLVLLDADMPEVDGADLCSVVRSDIRYTDLPVVLLTADRAAASIESVFSARADGCVAKPIVETELLLQVTNRLARLRSQRRLMETDGLTGTASRRKVVESTERLLRMSQRFDQPVSIAVLEIDRLREVNNSYGYVAGDTALRAVVELLQQSFRGEDVVGRWTGAELFIAMYGMSRDAGVQRMTDVLESVRARRIDGTQGSKFRITCSAGLVQSIDSGVTVEQLCRDARDALALAKRSGGDRVVAADVGDDDDRPFDIVLVEDDEGLAPLLLHAFETRSLAAHHIPSGSEAVAALAGTSPTVKGRVVVLDWDLPGASGLSVLRAMSSSGALQHTNVIMLTGRSTEAEVLEALQLGASDHVAKPFSVAVLMQRIHRLLSDGADS